MSAFLARAGKVLALASLPAAAWAVYSFLFRSGYSFAETEVSAGPEGRTIETSRTEGQLTTFDYALQEGDYAALVWPAVILVLAVMAATAGWKGRTGPVWFAAVALATLSVLGMWTIGLFAAGPASLLLLAAGLLTLSRRTARLRK